MIENAYESQPETNILKHVNLTANSSIISCAYSPTLELKTKINELKARFAKAQLCVSDSLCETVSQIPSQE